ncbi:MAG TPA: CDP-alcohol phosphatidyltransferase family protein [Dissulfurispiraceae bacterium]|nr:CDP-alcohol phosphatidyltransferase family protein [Dissulfurispiraceae bacterium]
MLSAWFGHFLDKPLAPLAKRIPFDPNVITIAGLVVTAIAAAIIPLDLSFGGLMILVGGAFDMLDGLIARTNGKRTRFGAFLDSTLDRYADSLLFIGVTWFFYKAGSPAGALLSVGSIVGSLVISYARARAEALGVECKVGIMERPERVILLALGCISGLLFPCIILIFVLSHFTVMQRIVHVYRQLKPGQ